MDGTRHRHTSSHCQPFSLWMPNTVGLAAMVDLSFITADGGDTWVQQNPPTNNAIQDFHFASQQVGWAAGHGGTVVHTTDGGQTWKSQKINSAAGISSICMLNHQKGWAAGGNGALIHTTDGGATWETQKSNVPNSNGMPEPIWSIHFIDANHGLAAAEFGVILRTTDGGANWASLEPRPVP